MPISKIVQIRCGWALVKSKELMVVLYDRRVHRAVSVVRIMKIETPLGKLGIYLSLEQGRDAGTVNMLILDSESCLGESSYGIRALAPLESRL